MGRFWQIERVYFAFAILRLPYFACAIYSRTSTVSRTSRSIRSRSGGDTLRSIAIPCSISAKKSAARVASLSFVVPREVDGGVPRLISSPAYSHRCPAAHSRHPCFAVNSCIVKMIINGQSEHFTRNSSLTIFLDRKSTRLNSSHLGISYAVFCLKKKQNT